MLAVGAGMVSLTIFTADVLSFDMDYIIYYWLVVLGLTALWDSISIYIGPSPREREKEK